MATIIKRNSTTTTNTTPSPLLRSVGYSLRGIRTVSDVIRQTINITIDEYGRVTNSNFSLGNRGDNLVTYLDFNIASVIQVEKLANYDVRLFIYNPRLNKSNLNPIKVEPQDGYTPDLVRFILESNWFSGAGTYELIFGLIEKDPDDGNVDRNLEVFLSDVMKANLVDTGIYGDFVEELIPGASPIDADNNFDEFIQKPHLTAQLENNALNIIGISNVNQWDAYTTYIQLEGFSPLLKYFYLIYNMPSVNNTVYGSVRFIEENGENGTTYKTWLPKSWTTAETKVRAWVVGTDLEIDQDMIENGSWRETTKVYVTNPFDFQTKTNFLDKENWATTLLESGDLKLLDKEENDILVVSDNIVGTYQLNYTGSEVDDLLAYANQLKNDGGDGKAIIDVEELPKLGWQGTTVPNTGYVEKVYVNTELSGEEACKLLNKLEYTDLNQNGRLYYLVYSNDGLIDETGSIEPLFLAIEKKSDNAFIFYQNAFDSSDIPNGAIYDPSGELGNAVIWGEGTNPIEVNMEVFYTPEAGSSLGVQNDLISSLFSTTPFEEEDIKKEIIYRTPDSRLYEWGKNVTKEEGKYVGTPIPTNEYIDKLYFNTQLNGEEVVNIISNLPYEEGMFPIFMYPDGSEYAFISIYHMSGVMTFIGKGNNIDDVMTGENTIFAYSPVPEMQEEISAMVNFIGWNPNINGTFEVASNWKELTNEQIAIFDENFEKISNLVSITEFEFVEGEEKVNEEFVEITSHNSYKTLETNYSYEGKGLKVGDVVKTLYFNTELQTSEVDKVLAGAFLATDVEPTFFKGVDEDNNEIYISGGWAPGSSNDFNMEGSMIAIHGQPYLEYGDESILYANGLYAIMSGISGFNKGSSFTLEKPITITEVHENFHLINSIISINKTFEKIETRKAIINSKGTRIYPKTDISQVEGLPAELAKKQDNLSSEYGINIALGTIASAAHISIGNPCVFNKETYEQIKKWLIKGLDVYVGTQGSYFGEEHYYSEVRGQVVEVAGSTDWDYLDYIDHFTVEFIVNGKSYRYKWSSSGVEEFIKTIDSSIENLETLPEKKWTGFPIQAEAVRSIADNNDKLYFNTNLSLEEIYNILKSFGSSSGTPVFLDEKLNSETNEYEIQQNMVIYYDSWENKVTVEMNNRNFDKLTTTSFSITYTDNNYTLEGTIPDCINISNDAYGSNRKSSGSGSTYKISSFISSKPFNYIAVDNPKMIFRTPDNKLWQYKYDIELTDGEPLSSGIKTVYLNFKQRSVNKLISILEQLTYDYQSTNNLPAASLGNAQYSSVEFEKGENKYTLYNWRTPILYIEKNPNGQWVLSEEKLGTITLTNYLNSQSTSQKNNSQLLRNFISRWEFKEIYIETEGFVELPKTPITDVEELPKLGWKGTLVPNTGTVENVYFNTNLNVEEVVSVLKQLIYTGDGINVILSSSDNTTFITVSKILNLENAYWIVYNSPETQKIIFASVNYESAVESIGWQTFDNPIIFNNDVAYQHPIDDNHLLVVGTQNNLISTLFSTTPFEYVGEESIKKEIIYRTPDGKLYQWYENNFIEIGANDDLIKVENEIYDGTTLVSKEDVRVDKIYFNTDLTAEQVLSLFNRIDLQSAGDVENAVYVLFATSNFTIVYMDMNTVYPGFGTVIARMTSEGEEILFATDYSASEFNGENWNPDFNGVIEVNDFGMSQSNIYEEFIENIGSQNNLLTKLISPTPFEISGKNITLVEDNLPLYPKTLVENVEGFAENVKTYETKNIGGYGTKINKYENSDDNILESAVLIYCDPETFDASIYNQIKEAIGKGLEVHLRKDIVGDGLNNQIRGTIVSVKGATDWDPFNMYTEFIMEFIEDGVTTHYYWTNGSVTKKIIGAITNIGNVTNEGYKGTVVPTSGTLEKIYFNKNLSKEEVNAVLRELTYTQTEFVPNLICPILFSSSGSPIIFAEHNPNTSFYAITIVTDMANSTYESAYDNFEGWTIESDNYAINSTVLSEYNGITIGEQNDKLVNIVSSTEFTKEQLKENTLYKKDNNKLYYVSNSKLVEISVEEGTIVANVDANGTYHFPDNMIELLRNNKVKKIILSVSGSMVIFNRSLVYNIDNGDYKIETYMFGNSTMNSSSALMLGVVNEQLVNSLVESTIYDQFNLEIRDGELELDVRTTDGDLAITRRVPVSTTTLNGESTYLATDAAAKNYVDEQVGAINTILDNILGEGE